MLKHFFIILHGETLILSTLKGGKAFFEFYFVSGIYRPLEDQAGWRAWKKKNSRWKY